MGAKYVFNPLTGNLDTTDVVAFNGEVEAGTDAAPSVFFTGDPNTGIYSPGADQVAISTNGTGRLFVDSSGKIYTNVASATGTNTIVEFSGTSENSTAPEIKISTTSAFNAFFRGLRFGIAGDTTDYSGIRFQPSSGELRIESGYATYGGLQTFYTNGSERMRLDSNGRLGLGTSSPGYAFDCVASSAGVVAARFRGNSSGNNNTQIRFYGANTATDQWAVGNAVATDDATRNFDIYDLVSNANRLRIDSSGRVGIGTTSPQGPLDVVTGSSGAIFRFDSASTWLNILPEDANGVVALRYRANSGSAPDLVFRNDAGTETGRLTNDGKLLVGTSSDSGGALLQVNGDRVRIATAKTPASASDTGTTGEICWDANYIYVCTATNTWKRSAISTW